MVISLSAKIYKKSDEYDTKNRRNNNYADNNSNFDTNLCGNQFGTEHFGFDFDNKEITT